MPGQWPVYVRGAFHYHLRRNVVTTPDLSKAVSKLQVNLLLPAVMNRHTCFECGFALLLAAWMLAGICTRDKPPASIVHRPTRTKGENEIVTSKLCKTLCT